jgi:cytochrome c-type biogenesis protein CcmH/NrfG
MAWKHIAALAALILVSLPAAAFNDGPSQQAPGVTFFVAIPLDAREAKEQSLYSGLAIQGKRPYETVRVDSRMFNDDRTFNFFGTAIGVKWIVAGAVAAGAVAAVASKDKSTAKNNQQSQQQQAAAQQQVQQQAAQQKQAQQQAQQQQTGGNNHPGHYEGDGCACHKL